MARLRLLAGVWRHLVASGVLLARAGRDRQAREALVALRRAAEGYAFEPTWTWPKDPLDLAFRPPAAWESISDYEALVLGAIVQEAAPLRAFEFGTGDGYSAWIIQRNSGATVWTLDLPGRAVEPDPRIVPLTGDSLTFDFAPYVGTMDFVFVDGNHASPWVEADTEHALALARSGATIVWHDCDGRHPAVKRCLTKLARRLPLRSVPGTRFVVLMERP